MDRPRHNLSKHNLSQGVSRLGVPPSRPGQEGTPSLVGGYPGYSLHPDLGAVTGLPPGKDMEPVEILWDGDGDGVPTPSVNRHL